MEALLGRIVDFGTHVFWWAGPESAGTDPNLTPVLMLLHHAVEAADAVSVLLGAGAADPCGPLLRSEMEAAISAFYILEADSSRRGAAYRYGLLREELAGLERLDPVTPKGQQQVKRLASDMTFGAGGQPLPSTDAAQLGARIAQLKTLMADAKYQAIAFEWERIVTERRREPAWHALFGGPVNVSELAARVGRAGWYDIFYRRFSDEVHSTSAIGSIRSNPIEKTTAFRPIRYPDNAPHCLSLGGSVLLDLYRELIPRFCREHEAEFALWYADAVSAEFMTLVGVEFMPRT